MFRRIDTTPVPSRGSLTTVLSSSKSRSDPSVGSTSSNSRRPASPSPSAVRESAAEKNMLFSCTARRRPSLTSSGAVKSISARAFAMMSCPSMFVNRIGSVAALMMLNSSACSRRTRGSSSPNPHGDTAHALETSAQRISDPANARRGHVRGGADEHQPERRFVARAADFDGRKGGVAEHAETASRAGCGKRSPSRWSARGRADDWSRRAAAQASSPVAAACRRLRCR